MYWGHHVYKFHAHPLHILWVINIFAIHCFFFPLVYFRFYTSAPIFNVMETVWNLHNIIRSLSGKTSTHFLWKGIRVTMLFDLLTCTMQCCYIQCMIIQCLIFLLQFQFDFTTFHFFLLQSCFRAFDIFLRPCRIFIVQCVMPFFVLPLFILRPASILTPSCHHCFVYANCNYTSRWRFTRAP